MTVAPADEAPTLPTAMAANLGYLGDADEPPVGSDAWDDKTQVLTGFTPYIPPARSDNPDDNTQVLSDSVPYLPPARSVPNEPPTVNLSGVGVQQDTVALGDIPGAGIMSRESAARILASAAQTMQAGDEAEVPAAKFGRAAARTSFHVDHGVRAVLAGFFQELAHGFSREDMMAAVIDAMHQLPKPQ